MRMSKDEFNRKLAEMLDTPYPEEHHAEAEGLVITFMTEQRYGEAMTYYQIISNAHWARVKHLSILADNAMAAVREANARSGSAETATAIAQLTPLVMALKKLLDK